MNNKILFGIILIFKSILCYATAQIPDYIRYNGKTYSLFTNPMESYFFEFPDKRPKGQFFTANWRGYVATFEIKQNELYIIRIDSGGFNVIKECINGLDTTKVDWFNGLLILPYGERIKYVHLGYESLYEHYILIEIHNGNVYKEYNLNGEQYELFRSAKMELWKKTEEYTELAVKYNFEYETKEYEEILFELINQSMPDEVIDYLIREYDIIKNMKLNVIVFDHKDKEITENNYIKKYLIIILCGLSILIYGIIFMFLNIKYKKKPNFA